MLSDMVPCSFTTPDGVPPATSTENGNATRMRFALGTIPTAEAPSMFSRWIVVLSPVGTPINPACNTSVMNLRRSADGSKRGRSMTCGIVWLACNPDNTSEIAVRSTAATRRNRPARAA